jgi:hypothetical protein
VFPAVVLAALLGAWLATPVSGASPEGGTVVQVEMDLKATNGYRAHLETSEKGTVELELETEDTYASYEVKGEATEAGLKVRFGRLGLIDVGFTPTEVLSSTEPSPGCTGRPRTLSEGFFAGTVEFQGERDFTGLEGPGAKGSMSVISPWDCPGIEEKFPFASLSRRAKPNPGSGRRKPESAWLVAAGRRCSCFFSGRVDGRHSGGSSHFQALAYETREGMKIQRAISVTGPASAFDFDFAAGTATLRPPAPFTGRATFTGRGSHSLGVWDSTISAPLPGARPVRIGGPGFQAILSPGNANGNDD